MPDSSRCHQIMKSLMVPESCQDGFVAAYQAIERCDRFHERQFTSFLDPETINFVKKLNSQNDGALMFFGGYKEAEYQMLGVFPSHEQPSQAEFPLTLMAFDYTTQFGTIAHKDVLGALMSLGLERKVFGDLLVHLGHVEFLVKSSLVQYVQSHLDQVKHMGINLKELPLELLQPPVQERIPVCFSVPSLRLDAVVAGAFNLSRTQAVNYIQQGHVKLNYSVMDKVDYHVVPEDLISARRLGRFYVGESQGFSKKGKLRIAGEKILIKV